MSDEGPQTLIGQMLKAETVEVYLGRDGRASVMLVDKNDGVIAQTDIMPNKMAVDLAQWIAEQWAKEKKE